MISCKNFGEKCDKKHIENAIISICVCLQLKVYLSFFIDWTSQLYLFIDYVRVLIEKIRVKDQKQIFKFAV